MRPAEVLAVVVSYNGLQQVRQTVEALRPQVGHVHIVDNGSGAESLAVLEALEREPRVSVERLGENRGLGYALNCGVTRARASGFAWLLTMDQDTVVDGSLIRAYQAVVERVPELSCLAPTISNGAKAEADGGAVRYAITSGNLVRVSVYDQVGLYDEDYFIDCIDFDFSLRVRRAGHTIHRVAGALMRHQLGEVASVPDFLGRYYARHSPLRRYYMYRNYCYLARRYLFVFPAFIIKLGLAQAFLTVLIGFLDPEPVASYRAMARGIGDFLAHRSGPYVERA